MKNATPVPRAQPQREVSQDEKMMMMTIVIMVMMMIVRWNGEHSRLRTASTTGEKMKKISVMTMMMVVLEK